MRRPNADERPPDLPEEQIRALLEECGLPMNDSERTEEGSRLKASLAVWHATLLNPN
jgi:hypothetical protein